MATCPSGHESASSDFCDVCGIRIDAPALSQTGPGAGAGTQSTGTQSTGIQSTGIQSTGTPNTETAPGEGCPRCGAPRTGQFCEACGYDYTAGTPDLSASTMPPTVTSLPVTPPSAIPATTREPQAPPQAPPEPAPQAPAEPAPQAEAAWTAVVTADRAHYDSVQAAGGPDAGEIHFPAYCPERRFRLSGAEVRVGRRSVSRGIDPEIDLTGPPADPGVSRLHVVLIEAPDGTWSVVDPGSENGTLVNGNEIPHGQAVPLHDGDRIHLGAWTALTITRGA
jgi:pSer/pThr/pTyr-binding forkhead associated (FHA) protein